jgi:hypothetical protein
MTGSRPRWSRGLPAAACLLVLVSCRSAAAPLYSDTTPPIMVTTPADAGVTDLRSRYRAAFCRRLPADGALPVATCDAGTGQELDDLRRDVRLEWWRRHRAAISLPIFLLVTAPRRDRVSPLPAAMYRELAQTEPRNDGMLFWYDQLVSRASLLGYVNADHWSVAVPLSRGCGPWTFSSTTMRCRAPCWCRRRSTWSTKPSARGHADDMLE